MVRLVTEAFSQQEWTDTVSRFYDLSLMQTWEFAEAKAQTGSWKVERATFLDGECVVGAVQALVRAIPGSAEDLCGSTVAPSGGGRKVRILRG